MVSHSGSDALLVRCRLQHKHERLPGQRGRDIGVSGTALTCAPVKIEVIALYVAKLLEGLSEVVFLAFFVEIGDKDYPALHSCRIGARDSGQSGVAKRGQTTKNCACPTKAPEQVQLFTRHISAASLPDLSQISLLRAVRAQQKGLCRSRTRKQFSSK